MTDLSLTLTRVTVNGYSVVIRVSPCSVRDTVWSEASLYSVSLTLFLLTSPYVAPVFRS